MEDVYLYKQRTEVSANELVRSVYNWMFIGLALTGFIAYYVSHSEVILRLVFGNQLIFFGLIIAELAMVFSISGMVNRLSPAMATGLFIAYSSLNGVTLSFIFLAFTSASIASTFFICSATFLVCSVYGWVTKRDLSSWGSFFFMGLVGIIIASVVNMFIQSNSMTMIISYLGVFIFVGLTIYDTQKIKNLAAERPQGMEGVATRNLAILGALSLYLDFINLFLMLLRIMGNRE